MTICINLVIILLMKARADIREVHFFPFNPVDKRTALTYIDSNGNWHRASKGAPEQVGRYFRPRRTNHH